MKFKKKLSIFAMLCIFVMNINFNFASNTLVQSGPQPELQKVSVTENVYPTQTSISNSVYQETTDFGESFTEAFTISNKACISGGLSRYDYSDVFSFTSSVEQDMFIQFNCASDSIITIYNSNRKEIAKHEGYYIHGSLTFHAEKGNQYFIEIVSKDFGDTFNYTIKTSSSVDDYTENFNTATEIYIGQTIVGNLVNEIDVDCFKFSPNKKGTYYISSIDYNYLVDVYDENGTQVEICKNNVILIQVQKV